MNDGLVNFKEGSKVTLITSKVNKGKLNVHGAGIEQYESLTCNGGVVNLFENSVVEFSQSKLEINGGEVVFHPLSQISITNSILHLNGGDLIIFDSSVQTQPLFETVIIDGGELFFNSSNDLYIENLYMNDGKRSGFGIIEVSNVFTWKGGKLYESGITKNMKLMVVEGDSLMEIDEGHTLVNYGNVTLLEGTLEAGAFTRIVNKPNAVFEIGGQGKLNPTSENEALPLFINYGIFAKISTADTFEFLLGLQNHEFVLIENGSLSIGTDSFSTDTIQINEGCTLELTGKFDLLNTSIVVNSPGNIHVSRPESNVFVDGLFDHSGQFLIDDGEVTFGNSVVVDQVNLVMNDGLVNFKEGSKVTLITSKVNKGKLNVHGAGIEQYESLTCNGGVVNLFENSVVEFSQSKLEINGGEVVFHPLSQISITNSILHLNGGDLIIFDSSVQTQPLFETVIIDGGELFFNSSNDLYIENLYMNDGKRSGFGIIEVSNVFTWKGGKLYESGITKNMKLMVVEGDSLMEIDDGHTLVNYGNVTLLEGTLEAGAFTRIVNKPNAVFEIGGQGKLNPTSENEALPLFINYGIFAKISTADTFEFLLGLQNHEFVLIENGTLSIGTDSFSTDTIQINEGCTLELTGKFDFLNTSIVVNSPGNIHVSRPESNVFVDGLFDHSGQLLIDDGEVTFAHDLYVEKGFIVQSGGLFQAFGIIDELKLNISGGSAQILDVLIKNLSTIELSRSGLINITKYSTIDFSDSLWKVSGGQLLFNDGSSSNITNVNLFQDDGLIYFEDTFLPIVGHFEEVYLCGGILLLNNNNSINTETFKLCGGIRSGNGNMNVTQHFSWTAGTLTDPGTTTVLANSLFTENKPKDLLNGHSLINYDEMTIEDTLIHLVNGSQIINTNYGHVYFKNQASLIGEINTDLDPSVVNHGKFTVHSDSLALISSDFFNFGDVFVLDDSIIDIGGVSSHSTGLINASYSSTIKIHGTFEFGDQASVYGGGSLFVYSMNGKVDILTVFDLINNITVTDSAVLSLSKPDSCHLYPSTVKVSNASLLIEHCIVDGLDLFVSDNGIVFINGTANITGFNLDLEFGKVFLMDSSRLVATYSNWTLGPFIAEFDIFTGSELSGLLHSVTLLENSMLYIGNESIGALEFNHLNLDGGSLNYSDKQSDLLVDNLFSFNGTRLGTGNISVTDSLDVKNLEMSGDATTQALIDSKCIISYGRIDLFNHHFVLHCTVLIQESTINCNNSIIDQEYNVLVFNNSEFIGSNSEFNSFSKVSIENAFRTSINSTFHSLVTVYSNSSLINSDQLVFSSSSNCNSFGSIVTEFDGTSYLYGTLECFEHYCLINYGFTEFVNDSNNVNLSIRSLDGYVLISHDAIFVDNVTISSIDGTVRVFSDLIHLQIQESTGGLIDLSSEVQYFSVNSFEGGLLLINSTAKVLNIKEFVSSNYANVIINDGSFLNMTNSLLEINGGLFEIQEFAEVSFGSPSTCKISQSNGNIASQINLELDLFEISGGVFTSNASISTFIIKGGVVDYANLSVEVIQTCTESPSTFINSFISLTGSISSLCSSDIILEGSDLVIQKALIDSIVEFLGIFGDNYSSVLFNSSLIFSELNNLEINSQTFIPFGAEIAGNLTISDPQFTGDVVLNSTAQLSVESFILPKSSSLVVFNGAISFGNIHISGSLMVFGHYQHGGLLNLTSTSIVNVSIHDKLTFDTIAVESINYNGDLFINFEPTFELRRGTQFTFFEHDSHTGKFNEITGNCLSNFGFNYTSTQMYAEVGNKIDPDYRYYFFISPLGFDSLCCGPSDVPCKTLEATLSRTLEDDYIEFLKGNYSEYEPLVFRNTGIGVVNGSNNKFTCENGGIGLEIISEGNLTVSGFNFTECETAIKSTNSVLNIDNLKVNSSLISLSSRIIDSVHSKINLVNSQFSDLSGPLISVGSGSQLEIYSITIASIDGIVFNAESSTLFINDFVATHLNNNLISSTNSKLKFNNTNIRESLGSICVELFNGNNEFSDFRVINSQYSETIFKTIHSDLAVDTFIISNVVTPLVFNTFKSIVSLANINQLSETNQLLITRKSFIRISDSPLDNYHLTEPLIISHSSSFDINNVDINSDLQSILIATTSGDLFISNSKLVSSKQPAIQGLSIQSITIINSSFSNSNQAVYSSNIDSLDVQNSSFVSCSSVSGGAIFVDSNSFSITNSIFQQNTATEFGGAIFINKVEPRHSVIDKCVFTLNTAPIGGSVYINLTQLFRINSINSENIASNYGSDFASPPFRIVAEQQNFTSVFLFIQDVFNNTVPINRHVALIPGTGTFAFEGNPVKNFVEGKADFINVSVLGAPAFHSAFAVSSGLLPAEFTIEGGECKEGQEIDGEGHCVDCPIGTKFVNGKCEPCPLGSWNSAARSSSCSQCLPGTRRGPNDTGCTPCDHRSVAPDQGMDECIPCGLRMGANEDFTECVCMGNLYYLDGDCIQCPSGLWCESFNEFCVQDSFYQADDGTVSFCKISGCRGNCTSTESCFEGYEGPLCSYCQDGMYASGNLCLECPHLLLIILAIIVQITLYLSLVPLLKLDSRTKFSSLRFYLPLVRFIQALCAIRTVTAIELPVAVHRVFDFLDLILLRPWGSPIAGCAGLPAGFNSLYWGSAMLLPIILVIGSLRRAVALSSVFFQLFFAVPAHNLLSVFSCRGLDSTDFKFSIFYNDLQCGSLIWIIQFIITFLIISIYFGFIVYFYFIPKKRVFTSTIASKSFIDEFGFQVHLLLVVGVVFLFEGPGLLFQSAFGFVACLVALAINSRRRSYVNEIAHSLQTTYLAIEAVLFMLVFAISLDFINYSKMFIDTVLIFIGFVAIFSLIVSIRAFVFGKVGTLHKFNRAFATNILQNPFVYLGRTDSESCNN
ncbi:hypothetical protein P9112_003279 [Eukaryota sp. TZLM1-RC]